MTLTLILDIKMKTILVPVDFSSRSEFATKLAAKIAKTANSKVYLLHLVELPTGVIDMGTGSRLSIPESMMYLRKVKEKILEFKERFFTDDHTVSYIIKLQNPHEGIKKYSQKINADLIVMGSQGVSDFEEMIIGSNAEKTVRTSTIPVIVVKTDPENFSLNNIVFASNFKEDNKKAFEKLIAFINKFNCKLHLLKVNTIGQFETTLASKQKIENFISNFQVTNYTINVYNDTSVEDGIINFSNDINADLIALSTHGRSGLSHLFNGSIAKSLSKHALKPVITFKI